MNLLQSLALRTLEAVPPIAPPRVPFVNVFPEEQIQTSEIPLAGLPTAGSTARAARTPDVQQPSSLVPPTPPRPRADAQPSPASSLEHRSGDIGHSLPREPDDASITHVVERIVEIEPVVVHRDSVAAPSEPAPQGTPPSPPIVSREVHEQHHHHWIEHHDAPVVHVVEEISTTPGRSPREIEPRAVRPAPVPAAAPSSGRAPLVPARITTREQAAPEPEPSVPPTAIHVAIGRVTVRMSPQTTPARTNTTRPVAPDVDLSAYSAAQRNRKR